MRESLTFAKQKAVAIHAFAQIERHAYLSPSRPRLPAISRSLSVSIHQD